MTHEEYPDRTATIEKLQQLRDTAAGSVSITYNGRDIRAESLLNMLRIEVLDPTGTSVPNGLLALADRLADQLCGNDITTRDGDSPQQVIDAAKHHLTTTTGVSE